MQYIYQLGCLYCTLSVKIFVGLLRSLFVDLHLVGLLRRVVDLSDIGRRPCLESCLNQRSNGSDHAATVLSKPIRQSSSIFDHVIR